MKRGPKLGTMNKDSFASKLEELKVGDFLYLFGRSQGYANGVVCKRNNVIQHQLKIKTEMLLLISPKTLKTEVVYKITRLK